MKPFAPVAALAFCNWGGIEIEINETGEAVRYRFTNDNKPSRRTCKIQYTTAGRAYFRANKRRYYLDEFMSI